MDCRKRILYSKRLRRHFQGACLNTGAQKRVVGERQTIAFCERHNMRDKLEPSVTRFKFGDGTFPSLGKIEARIPTPNGSYLKIDMRVLSTDVHMLLGLDVLDRKSIVANNVHNELEAMHAGWTMPPQGNSEICTYLGVPNTFLPRTELLKLHRHFRHPSADKLYAVIKRVRKDQAESSTLELLRKISKGWITCETFSAPPQRFRVSFHPTDSVFNREVSMDVM